MDVSVLSSGSGGVLLDGCALHSYLADTGTMLHSVNVEKQYDYLVNVNGFDETPLREFALFGGEKKLEKADIVFFGNEEQRTAGIVTSVADDRIVLVIGFDNNVLSVELDSSRLPEAALENASVVRMVFPSNEFIVLSFCENELGYSPAASCGILANISHESGFRTTASSGNGYSYGLCQWTAERKTALNKYCREYGLDQNGIIGQLRYLREELENDSKYTGLNEILLSLGNEEADAAAAGREWCWKFEQPADTAKLGTQRADLAKEYFKLYVDLDNE